MQFNLFITETTTCASKDIVRNLGFALAAARRRASALGYTIEYEPVINALAR